MVSPKRSRSVIVISSVSDVFDNSAPIESLSSVIASHQDGESYISSNKCSPPDLKQFHPAEHSKHEVFIGNLKHDVPDLTLIRNLQELFFKKVGLNIPDYRFQLFKRQSKRHPRKYGFLLLACKADAEKAYQLHDEDNLEYVIEGLKLNVTKRLSVRNRLTKWNKITFNGRRTLVNRSKSDTLLPTVRKLNESKRKSSNRKRQFYYGQYLTTEDRVTEYKRGSGNYFKNMLASHIRRYVCAFLNSEGGRLIIGVDDSCKVYGISCTRKQEDMARCTIDNIIKYFQPHVSPHMYMVDFVPVRLMPSELSEEFDSIDPLLKVLEVTVMKQSILSTLYTTDKEEVFMRRDGSVEGPLKSSQIIEWCRTCFAKNVPAPVAVEPEKIKTTLCNRCSDNQLGGSNKITDRLDEITTNQTQVLKKLEDTLLDGHNQLRQQVQQLQEKVEKKEDCIQDLKINLRKARSELDNVKRRSNAPKHMCIIV